MTSRLHIGSLDFEECSLCSNLRRYYVSKRILFHAYRYLEKTEYNDEYKENQDAQFQV